MWVEQLPNGKYKYFERYKDTYTEKWKRVSVTLNSGSNRAKKEAQRLLDDKIARKIESSSTTNVSFHSAFNEWWEFHQKQIKLSSIKSLAASVKRISDAIEQGTILSNINVRLIQSLLDTEDWTDSQKYRAKTVLNTFFDYAIDQQLISDNPSRKARLPKKKNKLEKQQTAKNKYLEPDEYSRLLKELYRKDITLRYALACEFMLLNGCRIGELAGLTVSDYHKETRSLDIHTSFNRYIPENEGTKTVASYRTTYLTNREIEIIDQILELKDLSETTNPNWYHSDKIFTTNTGKPIHSTILSASLQRANARLETPIDKHLSPHIFRHTTISILAENNVPLKTIMDRVGHADSEVTTSIYTHVTRNMKDQAVNVLDNIITNNLAPSLPLGYKKRTLGLT